MIDQKQALQIAQERAAHNGWGFDEPFQVLVRRGWLGAVRSYEIESGAGRLGTKARFSIDAKTGGVLSEGYIPR